MKRVAIALALVACRSSHQATPAVQASAATPSASASPVDAGDARRAIVDAWNDAHDAHAAAAFDSLYADEVVFYQNRVSRAQCVAVKKGLLSRSPDFKQTVRDVRFEDHGATTRATFVKSVTVNGKTTDYPSYLELARRGAGWVITAESDEISDRNLAAKRCTPIAWGNDWPHDASPVELTGRVSRSSAPNATGDVEQYYMLTLDKPACLPPGGELKESTTVHLYGDGAGDPKPFVGKHVRVKGDAFEQHTAHHHEPIVMKADSYVVEP